METEICTWSTKRAKVKKKKNAYGVKFTHVSKSVHMRQFAYVSKFAYTQINTHVNKSVYVYRAVDTFSRVAIQLWVLPGCYSLIESCMFVRISDTFLWQRYMYLSCDIIEFTINMKSTLAKLRSSAYTLRLI